MVLIVIIIILAIAWIILKLLQIKQEVHPFVYKSKSVYSDHTIVPEKPFYSPKYKLAGKMDKILLISGKRIPMEIKSSRKPLEPYQNHVMQLMSYCLLLEEHYKEAPEYGVLQYPTGKPFIIPYTKKNKQHLFGIMEEMRNHIISRKGPSKHLV